MIAKLFVPLALLVALCVASWGAVRYYREGIPTHTLPTAAPVAPSWRSRAPVSGPLRRDAINPRYFADANGHAVVLAGAHTWANFQDNGLGDPPPAFDYEAYLRFLVANNLNFVRLWVWENARWAPWVTTNDYYYSPDPPYRRTGPGNALDGKPKFNLDSLDPAYFQRLRARVAEAGRRGVYVSVMLFNAWSIDNKHMNLLRGNPWHGHPFNRSNNVNGIDGDPNGDDGGEETHELLVPRVTAYQDAYVRRVVDAVNDLDNVLYEISNESYSPSRDWQYHMINLVHDYERTKPRQHPVGMTQYQHPGKNAELFNGPADWISPWEELPDYPYRDNPRESDGRKVVIVDTDHLWGIGGTRAWAWKSFMRGNNPSFMDGYDGAAVGSGAPSPWDVRLATLHEIGSDIYHRGADRQRGWQPNAPKWVSLRSNLGYILDFSRRVDLDAMRPQSALSSTGYCLAHVGEHGAEYLVYAPDSSKSVEVNLSGFRGVLLPEWFDPETARTIVAQPLRGGATTRFSVPFKHDAVLYLHVATRSDSAGQGGR